MDFVIESRDLHSECNLNSSLVAISCLVKEHTCTAELGQHLFFGLF